MNRTTKLKTKDAHTIGYEMQFKYL